MFSRTFIIHVYIDKNISEMCNESHKYTYESYYIDSQKRRFNRRKTIKGKVNAW